MAYGTAGAFAEKADLHADATLSEVNKTREKDRIA
jgi:hypothetical protein